VRTIALLALLVGAANAHAQTWFGPLLAKCVRALLAPEPHVRWPVLPEVTLFPEEHDGLPPGALSITVQAASGPSVYYSTTRSNAESPIEPHKYDLPPFASLAYNRLEEDGIAMVHAIHVDESLDFLVAGRFLIQRAFRNLSMPQLAFVIRSRPLNDRLKRFPSRADFTHARSIAERFSANPRCVDSLQEYQIASAAGYSEIDVDRSGIWNVPGHNQDGLFVLFLKRPGSR
jgi:hypothetical protein